MSDRQGLRGGGFDWEAAEDLTTLSEEELRRRLGELIEEERAISYRREILRGRLDLMRAELLRRGSLAASPEELVRALMGDPEEGRR